MIVNLSEDASNAALDAIGQMMNGGAIELLTGNGGVLVTLRLANPATQTAVDAELVFNHIAEGDAALSGEAKFGRIVDRDGHEILAVDVGPADSDAVIKLTPTLITRNAPVRLNSFRLAIP
jgi:hypothetical protein